MSSKKRKRRSSKGSVSREEPATPAKPIKQEEPSSSGRLFEQVNLEYSAIPTLAPDTHAGRKRGKKQRIRERKRRKKEMTASANHEQPILTAVEKREPQPRLTIAFKDVFGTSNADPTAPPDENNKVPTPLCPTIVVPRDHLPPSLDISLAPRRDLGIRLMRHASPQIETIATSTSPTHIKLAVGLLHLLRSSTRHLHSQIEAFKIALRTAHSNLMTFQGLTSNACRIKVRTRIETFEEIIALAEEHASELCVWEFALRDVVDEESGAELAAYVERMKGDLEDLVEKYEEKLSRLVCRVSSDVLNGEVI